jgi:cation diffusion facilitator CzcD-associated flavoprotein CzcO
MAEVTDTYDAVIVGAGIAGMYGVWKLRGEGFRVRAFERGDGVGGTWYWNRYPGARCDVDSVDYSFSFDEELEQEWDWTERYPTQPELLRYFNHVADRFDLRRDIQLNTTVTSASYDEARARWIITTDDGRTTAARFLITASGCLSLVNRPDFPGLEDFTGDWYHTARWPEEDVDLTGKRVGIIGTGSTGIQLIPQLARQADHLTVFQRTPNFSVPARNAPLDPAEAAAVKANYRKIRKDNRESAFGQMRVANDQSALEVTPAEVKAEMDARWEVGGGPAVMLCFTDVLVDDRANEIVADYVRDQIRATVKDPETAERLCPTNHPIGCKRICVDIDYFETYNRDNVDLVDVREAPIEAITETGIRLEDGREFTLDVIVFATGFDAMTGTLFEMNITGRDGQRLQDKWSEGPRTYLGLSTSGFPNLFMVTGPGSPSVLSNMMVSVEQHIDWITGALVHAREQGVDVVEAAPAAEERWSAHVANVANATLFPKANSWYMGRNIPGKPRVMSPYVGGVGLYREQCRRVAEHGYEGFAFDGDEVPVTHADPDKTMADQLAAAG